MKNFKLSNSTMERLELLLQQLSKVYPQTELQLADSNKLMSCNCGGGCRGGCSGRCGGCGGSSCKGFLKLF